MQRFVKDDYQRFALEVMVDREAADEARILELYHRCKDSALYDFCVDNEIASIAGARLSALLDDPPQHWLEAAEAMAQTQGARLAALDQLAAVLEQAGIPLVALKNAGIARGIYPHLSECPMGDVDLLVSREDFPQAHQLLMEQGCTLGFRVADTIEEEGLEAGLESGGTEYAYELDGDTLWVELQWRPIAGRWIPLEAEPRAAEVIARSLPIEGSPVRLLAPNDNLLQVCLHTAKHTYVRAPGLRLHTDVDRIVRRQPIDWEAFVAEVKARRLQTACYFSLAIPQALLRTPIPDEVLDSLAPPEWKRSLMLRWLRQADLFWPGRPKFNKMRYIAFVSLLFDDLPAFKAGLFPSPDALPGYRQESGLALVKRYGERLWDLATRRVKQT